MSSTPDLSPAKWVKSSYSGNGGGSCVEWAPNIAASGMVPVRDSKAPDGPALIFEAAAWASFVAFAKTCDI
ncbi:DUF397 domain-containing protein [Streptomyces sp. ME19-01-6]|uniref:DUF397 domain-containing protein n=1 Tax=Streptomyces sp. ME19-01-6 TaxID=3028686 RepID=UPI0029AFD231|nr:DUF397 domain-containing protein [Streptomyces sp. ME19-01-6]MDX3227034.1 DUF397 domain-containing protein [Streptomyces sp. ME19-01-6]